MNALDVLGELYTRGVRLQIGRDTIRLRAPEGVLTVSLRLCVAQHKESIIELLGEGEFPDETLPDTLYIPASTPNTIQALRECIDRQRVDRKAA
jgi:hypothetical protein